MMRSEQGIISHSDKACFEYRLNYSLKFSCETTSGLIIVDINMELSLLTLFRGSFRAVLDRDSCRNLRRSGMCC
jgi:hypothetical protein